MDRLKIRYRWRREASPPPGMKQSWDEWQIVDGRKIVARCGSEAEAQDRLEQIRKGKSHG